MKQAQHHSEAREELRRARARAKRRLEHLSREARVRWQELEGKLDKLEHAIEQGTERSAEMLLARARRLAASVAEFLDYDAHESLWETSVRTLMTEPVASCSWDDTLDRAARIMWETDCGAVPVLGKEQTLVGMITDRDICMAAYTQGASLGSAKVASAMSRVLHRCTTEDSVGQALRIMSEQGVRRLPVLTVDQKPRLAGILSLADVALHVASLGPAAQADAYEALVATLAALSTPTALVTAERLPAA